MNNELTFERYQALNRTFRKELIFHLGSDAGFYSEFNNMILAIIYCLQYNCNLHIYIFVTISQFPVFYLS